MFTATRNPFWVLLSVLDHVGSFFRHAKTWQQKKEIFLRELSISTLEIDRNGRGLVDCEPVEA